MSLKISIITIVRNAKATVLDAVESVVRQDYPEREHVIVDGGSTDGTLAVLAAHRHHFQAFISEPDEGIYDAFNKGVRLATGDVIAFLNADDMYESDDVLTEIANQFQDASVDVVFGDVAMVSPDDTSAVVRYYSSRKFAPSRLARGFMPAHPSMFVRRSVFEKYGLFDASYRIAGDFEWTARVFRDGLIRYRYVPRAMVRMRRGGASTRSIMSTIRITREIRRACEGLDIRTSYLQLCSRFPEKLLEYLKNRKGS